MSVYLFFIMVMLFCLSFTTLGAKIYKSGFIDGQKEKSGDKIEQKSLIDSLIEVPDKIHENKLRREAEERAAKEDREWQNLLSYTGDEE